MSRSTQQLKELTTGVHLVIIGGFTAVKNPDGSLKESKTGKKLIQVRFTDNFNKSFDKQYWVKGSREFEFNKIMTCVGIDRTKYSTFKEMIAEALNKRLWLCIQEVSLIDGEDIIETYNQIFDYEPCINPEKKPVKKGDPANHPKGIPQGDFITCKQINFPKQIEIEQEKKSKEHLTPTIEHLKKQEAEIQMDAIWDATKLEEKAFSGDKNKVFEQDEVGLFPTINKKEVKDKVIDETLEMYGLAPTTINKKEIIAKAKEMIAKVESKVKEPKKDTDTINWEDYK